MRIPEKLPITRIENYHTHYLGKIDDGRLFWGYETFVFTKPYHEIPVNDWKKFRIEFAVLHTFDKQGNYLETQYHKALLVDSPDMNASLAELVTSLGNVRYQNIEVKPFQTMIEGTIFGLIPDEETETINLQPSFTISFQEPWDGEYYT